MVLGGESLDCSMFVLEAHGNRCCRCCRYTEFQTGCRWCIQNICGLSYIRTCHPERRRSCACG